MSPGTSATSVPKRTLVKTILHSLPEDLVRRELHIEPETSLRRRLGDFTKPELLALLTSTSEGERAFEETERRYPLFSPPTLYLTKVQRRPDTVQVIGRSVELADQGRSGGVAFGEDRAVRAVYVAGPAYTLDFNQGATEIPLLYERRLEYTECNPESDDYGERKVLYSLERAFIWILEEYSHALICCSDFEAVRPIIDYGRGFIDFRWALPDLTEEMLKRLAADSNPRSGTFSSSDLGIPAVFDARTITVSDPALGERVVFQQIDDDPGRQQTTGYYSNYPGLPIGGIGIARRYGRIWTPAHLSRAHLVGLAIDLIERTEQELSQEYDRNLRGYVGYFKNVPVAIEGHQLGGKERTVFDALVTAILEAAKRDDGEAPLDAELLHDLIEYQRRLALTVGAEFDCPECSDVVLAKCPECRLPYIAAVDNSELVFECPEPDCRQQPDAEQGFRCDCGSEVAIAALENHLLILPHPEFLHGAREFIGAMDDVVFDGLFFVRGHVLKLVLTRQQADRDTIQLEDLQLWRVRARHHLRVVPAEPIRARIIRILCKAKEKCARNDGHPTHEICHQCQGEQISARQVRAGEICLPRILGLAIFEGFDGVHHRYEIADVKYEDTIADVRQSVRLGIHLKRRTRSRPQGLGRSVRLIRGLYTQLFFSAYLALTDADIEFDILGISVPNTLKQDVVDSMTHLVNELGFPFLIVDEDEWVRILDGIIEQLEVAEDVEYVP